MPDAKEWTLRFNGESFFELSKNRYYIKNGKGIGLKEMDYCYFTQNSLDFIECKEVGTPDSKNIKLDCVLKGIHSLALVKTGLLEKNEQFLSGINNLTIPMDIKINMYFIFKTDTDEQKSQLWSIVPFIENNLCCFSTIWNINSIKVLSYDQAIEKITYIAEEDYKQKNLPSPV